MSEDEEWINYIRACLKATTKRPSWNAYFMSIAFLLSIRSTCNRLKVGCVLVSNENDAKNRIVSSGYNGSLEGLPHTSFVRDGHEQLTVHAEQNAIADAAKRGISVKNSTVYITHYPCLNCAKLLISAGIKQCFYHTDYNNDYIVARIFDEKSIKIDKI